MKHVKANTPGQTRTRSCAKCGAETLEMFPFQDIWLCAVSAAIGAMIAVLVSTLLNIPGNQEKRSYKCPQEHDERVS